MPMIGRRFIRNVLALLLALACTGIPSLSHALEVIFQSKYFPAEDLQMFDVHAHAAAVFQDAALDALARGAQDHL